MRFALTTGETVKVTHNPAKPAVTKVAEEAKPETFTLEVTRAQAEFIRTCAGKTNEHYSPEAEDLYFALGRAGVGMGKLTVAVNDYPTTQPETVGGVANHYELHHINMLRFVRP